MISDDLAPAVAAAGRPPTTTHTNNTPHSQAINPVGKVHATIRGRYCRSLPVAR